LWVGQESESFNVGEKEKVCEKIVDQTSTKYFKTPHMTFCLWQVSDQLYIFIGGHFTVLVIG
jgi:hypothetical protein